MLYYFVRPLARLSLRFYFRRIDLVGTEHIPRDKPVILAANHPTTFIEPCILACFLDRPLNFLARGDFFRKPLFARLLGSLHILPVFRLTDGGFEKLKNNYKTFQACFDALRQRKTLMILAEGRCIHEKRLRPLKKGTARVALGALDQYPDLEEVYIVPVGVNFTYGDRLRDHVMIEFGEPMLASTYMASFKEQANQAIAQFTDDLRDRLRETVIHVEALDNDLLAEATFQLDRSERPRRLRPTVGHQENGLQAELAIAERLNAAKEQDLTDLRALADRYFHRLRWLRLDDAAVRGRYKATMKKSGLNFLRLIPAVLIAVFHAPIWLLAQFIPGTKIRQLEFVSPVRWGSVTAGYLLYLLTILILLLTQAWVWAAVLVLALLAFPFAIRAFEDWSQTLLAYRAWRQTPRERERLQAERQELLTQLRERGILESS
jgi:1-acyl-sn-glycerol-3-phosphate acyltransferase